jgi:hypothetical protein
VITLVQRYLAEGQAALEPRSRRPLTSQQRTAQELKDEVVALRKDLDKSGHEARAATIAFSPRTAPRDESGIVRLFSVWGGRVVFTRDVVLRRPGSGGCGHADGLVPGGESGVHLVAVTGCGESVSTGPKVR